MKADISAEARKSRRAAVRKFHKEIDSSLFHFSIFIFQFSMRRKLGLKAEELKVNKEMIPQF